MLRNRLARFFRNKTEGTMSVADSRMAILSYLAYAECWNPKPARVEAGVRSAVEAAAGDIGVRKIVWGPVAYRKKGLLLTDSLMYAVQDTAGEKEGEERYTLVIRGTNPGSVTSWIFQDLSVHGLVPWTRRSPKSVHRNAWISQATDNALEIHETIEYRGKTALQWLLSILETASGKTVELKITGHSLGGLMSTVFALYLRDELAAAGLSKRVKLSVCAFAGPTAGNKGFSDALLKEFGSDLSLFDNPLDLAPLAWEERNLASVMPALYEPVIKPNRLQRDALSAFAEAVRGLGYTKPHGRVKTVPSSVVEVPFNDFLLEAVVQHLAAYAEEALRGRREATVETVRNIVKKMLGVAQFAKFGKVRFGPLDQGKKKLKSLAKLF